MRFILVMVLLILTASIIAGDASAIGTILVAGEDTVRLSKVEIIYIVNSAAEEVTLIAQAYFVGGPNEFVWLIPAPRGVELELLESADVPFSQLDNATRVQFNIEDNAYCSTRYNVDINYGSGIDFVRGITNEVNILTSDQIENFLDQNGYSIDAHENVLQDYAVQDFSFVALS
ncbi:MAG: hypothetical protein CUN54_09210, partial [Phototrophicales bacterium]